MFLLLPLAIALAPPPLSAREPPLSARDAWLMSLSHGETPPNTGWPPLNGTEEAQLEAKAQAWLGHALRPGVAGHLQWGQAMPQVQYTDASMSAPLAYDDVGDTTAWSGQLLGALAHCYAAAGDDDADDANASATNATNATAVLGAVRAMLSSLDFVTSGCTGLPGYVPRAWARAVPDNGGGNGNGSSSSSSSAALLPWRAFRAYFTPSPPYINGSGTHGVYNCSSSSSSSSSTSSDGGWWVYQGGASRDTYIGALFGLGSAAMALRGRAGAAAELALAQAVFERIFDKLRADDFFIVHPRNCVKQPNEENCLPVNPTPSLIVAFQRLALTLNPGKYGAAVRPKYDLLLPLALRADTKIVAIGAPAYYANNLLSQCWYVLARLERAEAAGSKHWASIRARMLALLAEYRPHLQANLNAYWVAAANDTAADAGPWNTMARALLWDFGAPPAPERHVDRHNSSRYGPDVACSEGCGCSTYAMLVRDRPPNEYVWQVTPTKLEDGGGSSAASPKTEFGGAFLTSYWVWRTAGLF